jgi:Zn-dependent protease with chaperone function
MPMSLVPGTVAEYASQSITHAAIAVLVVEVLLRVWRIADADERVAFRLLPMLVPVLALPAFFALAPWRSADGFQHRWALFATERWGVVATAGVVGAVVLGMLLLLVDLPRFVRRCRGPHGDEAGPVVATPPALLAEVQTIAAAFGIPAPAVMVPATEGQALLVTGVRRPVLLVSEGTLAALDARERRAAVAHEMAHLARRDPILGWVLVAARVLAFFNPVTHLLARAVVREAEWRADDLAAAVTGDRAALASALAKVGGGHDGGRHRPAIAARHRRLVARPTGGRRAFPRLRVGLTGASLALLLFFVV